MPCCCCVKGCKYVKKTDDGVNYHRFPLKNEKLCIQWLLRAGFSSEDIRTYLNVPRCKQLEGILSYGLEIDTCFYKISQDRANVKLQQWRR